MIKLEKWDRDTGIREYGMSSGAGDTLDDLNANYKTLPNGEPMPQGSSAFDYTKVGGKNNVYFFDGMKWE